MWPYDNAPHAAPSQVVRSWPCPVSVPRRSPSWLFRVRGAARRCLLVQQPFQARHFLPMFRGLFPELQQVLGPARSCPRRRAAAPLLLRVRVPSVGRRGRALLLGPVPARGAALRRNAARTFVALRQLLSCSQHTSPFIPSCLLLLVCVCVYLAFAAHHPPTHSDKHPLGERKRKATRGTVAIEKWARHAARAFAWWRKKALTSPPCCCLLALWRRWLSWLCAASGSHRRHRRGLLHKHNKHDTKQAWSCLGLSERTAKIKKVWCVWCGAGCLFS